MTDNFKDSEPAFPIFPDTGGGHAAAFRGMTLRDYFAAKAMQGFAADSNAVWSEGAKGMAQSAYRWADAMMEARK